MGEGYTIREDKLAEFERTLMLQINENLFNKNKISQEIYYKAKEIILQR